MVVLSQLEKEEMEERLESALNAKDNPLQLLGTEVIFRQGNPILEQDLKKVSANTARSVIALTPPGKSASVLFCHMNSCVQYEVSMIWLLV